MESVTRILCPEFRLDSSNEIASCRDGDHRRAWHTNLIDLQPDSSIVLGACVKWYSPNPEDSDEADDFLVPRWQVATHELTDFLDNHRVEMYPSEGVPTDYSVATERRHFKMWERTPSQLFHWDPFNIAVYSLSPWAAELQVMLVDRYEVEDPFEGDRELTERAFGLWYAAQLSEQFNRL